MRRFLALLAVALLISGCATQAVPPDKLGRIKSVAVVTAIGDEIQHIHWGATVFNNTWTKARVDWNLDDHVRQQLVKLLSPHYELRPINYDVTPLLDATERTAPLSVGSRLDEAMKRALPRDRADVLVVVSRYFTHTKIGVADKFGFYTAGGFRNVIEGYVFTFYRVFVLDGRTLETIADDDARIPGPLFQFFAGYPGKKFDHRRLVKPIAEMSSAEFTGFRPLFTDLLDESLPHTLQRMKLIPAAPAN